MPVLVHYSHKPHVGNVAAQYAHSAAASPVQYSLRHGNGLGALLPPLPFQVWCKRLAAVAFIWRLTLIQSGK